MAGVSGKTIEVVRVLCIVLYMCCVHPLGEMLSMVLASFEFRPVGRTLCIDHR